MKSTLLNRTKFSLLILSCLLATSCAPKTTDKMIKKNQQAAEKYVNQPASRRIMSQQSQKQHQTAFLKNYFSPWNPQQKPDTTSIRTFFNKEYLFFSRVPGFGENEQKIDPMVINRAHENADIKALTASYQTAITTQISDIRRLPISSPSYDSPSTPGHSYPFDRLQNSLIGANVPVRIIHQSKDQVWSLIQCGYMIGWVQNNHLATVDSAFITQWQNKTFVTATTDHIPLHDLKNHFLFEARIGGIYPLIASDKNRYQILVADRDQQYRAKPKKVWVSKKQFGKWPLPPTVNQLTKQINQMLGEPYGWGGMYGYRDCSATTMDLFASFGIWLPRGAKDQANVGQYTNFAGLNSKEKINLINEQAKGLMTLIDLPGHVMLYIGSEKNTPFVFHNVWGLQTRKFSKYPGRLVIGQAVITPITLGEQYWDVHYSFLDQAKGMTVIK